MQHNGYPTKEEALQAVIEAYHVLGFALEEYAKVLCGEGKPGLAFAVASAMGLAREAHDNGLACKSNGTPKLVHVEPCGKRKG
jgi:hypothetical protein